MTYEPDSNHPILGKFTGEPVSPSDIKRSEVAQRINSLVSELDEMMVLAANPETYPFVAAEVIGLSQAQTRVQLVLSFIASHQPSKLKVISNG